MNLFKLYSYGWIYFVGIHRTTTNSITWLCRLKRGIVNSVTDQCALWRHHFFPGSAGPQPTPWWRHQMETFSASLAFVRGIHRSPVNSPHKGQWRGALMFSLICVWINGWVNTREAGDLRRYRAHYDVNVMTRLAFAVAVLVNLSGGLQKYNFFHVGWLYTIELSCALHWRHNERDGVSNHQPHDCLLNR